MFLMITNSGEQSKNYKIQTMTDEDYSSGKGEWKDLIESKDGMIINELDVFEDFMALYVKNRGRP